MKNESRTTVVSVTPLRVAADSRAFKIAASMARFGYASILVEGERSNLDEAQLPFSLLSMEDGKTNAPRPGNQASTPSAGLLEGRFRKNLVMAREALLRLPDPLKSLFRPLARLLVFFLYYGYYSFVRPILCIPRASIYYLHSYSLFPALYILSKKHRAPILYDAHDFYPGIRSSEEIQQLSVDQRWIIAFQRRIESRLAKYASNVITVSSGVAQLQREIFGCNPTVVRNCHDFRLDRIPPTDIKQSLRLSPRMYLIVVIGNAKEGMAIQEALAAITELPKHVHLAFLGSSYERFLSNRRLLTDRIHAISPVMPYEVVPFIRAADASMIIYYPRSVNYQNCLPNGFFQSIAAGLPILYPDLPEIRRVAEKYKIGIPIDARVPKSMIGAIKRLLDDPNLTVTFKKNLQRARKELNWEKEEVILRDLISRTLKNDQGMHASR